MHPVHDLIRSETRRQFLSRGSNAVSWAALAALLGRDGLASAGPEPRRPLPSPHRSAAARPPGPLHFAPKAKQVIYLHMVGGPPQMDMYDYKPAMDQWYDKDLPDSIRQGQRLTTMTSGQKRFPIAPSKYKFARHGECGMWTCELLPYTSAHGRRDVLHPQHAHRGHQPRAGDHLHADRQPDHRPAVPGGMGLVRSRVRSTTTCRPSSCWWPDRPTPSSCRRSRHGCGRRATSPVSMPASRSVAVVTRSFTSTTRPAFHRRCAGIPWTGCGP